MNVVTTTPCYGTAQFPVSQQQVNNPSLYFAYEYKPLPVPLLYFYTTMSSAPQMFSENSYKQSASKVFNESPIENQWLELKSQVPLFVEAAEMKSDTG